MRSLDLSYNLIEIGEGAFQETALSGELTIPHSVVSIGDSALIGLASLDYLVLGKNIEYIGSYAFSNCLEFHGPLILTNNVKKIGEYAFCNCSSFNYIRLSDSITSIGDYAFCNLTGVNQLNKIPSSLITIGNYSFALIWLLK